MLWQTHRDPKTTYRHDWVGRPPPAPQLPSFKSKSQHVLPAGQPWTPEHGYGLHYNSPQASYRLQQGCNPLAPQFLILGAQTSSPAAHQSPFVNIVTTPLLLHPKPECYLAIWVHGRQPLISDLSHTLLLFYPNGQTVLMYHDYQNKPINTCKQLRCTLSLTLYMNMPFQWVRY